MAKRKAKRDLLIYCRSYLPPTELKILQKSPPMPVTATSFTKNSRSIDTLPPWAAQPSAAIYNYPSASGSPVKARSKALTNPNPPAESAATQFTSPKRFTPSADQRISAERRPSRKPIDKPSSRVTSHHHKLTACFVRPIKLLSARSPMKNLPRRCATGIPLPSPCLTSTSGLMPFGCRERTGLLSADSVVRFPPSFGEGFMNPFTYPDFWGQKFDVFFASPKIF